MIWTKQLKALSAEVDKKRYLIAARQVAESRLGLLNPASQASLLQLWVIVTLPTSSVFMLSMHKPIAKPGWPDGR